MVILEVTLEYCMCIPRRLKDSGDCFEDMDDKFDGQSAIHFAASFNIYPCIVLLHDNGQDLEEKDDNETTPLSIASKKMNCNSVLTLIKLNATTENVSLDEEMKIKECLKVS